MSLVTTTTDARGVATLTLNRPEKHNALDGATMRDLDAALAWARQAPPVHYGVVEVRPSATHVVDGSWTTHLTYE